MSKRLYFARDSRIAGKLSEPSQKISFRQTLNKKQRYLLGIAGVVMATLNTFFLLWLINPSHIAKQTSSTASLVAVLCFISIVVIELIRVLQGATLWAFATKAVDPIPQIPQEGLRVAILTTIVPSKEPINIVKKTLKAMKKIEYNGKVDVWILDEGNDDRVKVMAKEIGVKHFSRKGVAKFNQPSGEFKAKSKAGNHNAWRAKYEHKYDVVAQMDPDHTPLKNFLIRTLGYFRDPNVAFVVAPQVYGNQSHRWLTKASASQAYIFHGIIQRGGNGLGSPLLIGTNHLYRPNAWKQIGGYQDSIIEDHLTSMKLHGTINPKTGNPWQSVYTPDIISVGEGPTSWTDYFNQQKRWAYGIWEILLKHSFGLQKNLKPGQRLSYAALQFFYPSVAVTWLLGNIVSVLYFILGVHSMTVSMLTWISYWSLSLITQLSFFFWLNRFNLTSHERKHGGLDAMLLTLVTIPVYVAAALDALMRKPLAYAVTAKGKLSSSDSFKTYQSHLTWASVAIALLLIESIRHTYSEAQSFWDVFTLIVTVVPATVFLCISKLNSWLNELIAIANRPITLQFVPYLKRAEPSN